MGKVTRLGSIALILTCLHLHSFCQKSSDDSLFKKIALILSEDERISFSIVHYIFEDSTEAQSHLFLTIRHQPRILESIDDKTSEFGEMILIDLMLELSEDNFELIGSFAVDMNKKKVWLIRIREYELNYKINKKDSVTFSRKRQRKIANYLTKWLYYQQG